MGSDLGRAPSMVETELGLRFPDFQSCDLPFTHATGLAWGSIPTINNQKLL